MQNSQPVSNHMMSEKTQTHLNPPAQKNNKLIKLGLALVSLLLLCAVAVGSYYLGSQNAQSQQDLGPNVSNLPDSSSNVACTMDAKLCPDGSSVGRSGPNCEFTECPAVAQDNWKTFTNTEHQFSLSYPSNKFVVCPYGKPGDLLLFSTPFACPDGTDAAYDMDARVVLADDHKQFKDPISSMPIIISGKNATQNEYVFTVEDGPLYERGEMTEIVLPITTDSLLVMTAYGNDAQREALFQSVILTLKFNN